MLEQECGKSMRKQKKAKKHTTMKQMLSLRDQSLKEKDSLKPKKKEKKESSALKDKSPSTLPTYSSNIILNLAYLTTSCLIPALSTFLLKPNWT